MHRIIFFLFISILGFGGCAKDQDVDDWKKEKIEEEFAKVAAVSGIYSGNVLNPRDESEQAGLILELEPSNAPSTGEYKTEERAALRIKMTFIQRDSFLLIFNDGSYDSDRKTILAEAVFEKGKLRLSAKVDGDIIRGDISAEGSSEFLSFALSRGGSNISIQSREEEAVPVIVRHYEAEFLDENNKKIPARLVIRYTRFNAHELLTHYFFPKRKVNIALFFGRAGRNNDWLEFPLTDGEWDERNGQLTGRADVRGQIQGSLILSCRDENPGGALKAETWNCLYASDFSGFTREVKFCKRRG